MLSMFNEKYADRRQELTMSVHRVKHANHCTLCIFQAAASGGFDVITRDIKKRKDYAFRRQFNAIPATQTFSLLLYILQGEVHRHASHQNSFHDQLSVLQKAMVMPFCFTAVLSAGSLHDAHHMLLQSMYKT